MNDIKQVIVIRKDLNMRFGKAIVQACHASMGFLGSITTYPIFGNNYEIYLTEVQRVWLDGIHKKICVTVNSEEELLKIGREADASGLEVTMVKDLGLTEFKEPTNTCLAIGPDYSEEIDKITGKLPLY